MHVAEKLLKKNLIGIDNLNKYYDVNLKERLKLKNTKILVL